MKRLIPALLGVVLVQSASASPELAEAWGSKAGDLYAKSTVLLDAAKTGRNEGLPAEYVQELERFAITATRLGTWNDEDGGAADLGCIFRGMAEEAEIQLITFEEATHPSDRQTALTRLAAMFDDAQIIATAAAHAARTTNSADTANAIPAPCEANPAVLDSLLND